jgi:hypothetical protein
MFCKKVIAFTVGALGACFVASLVSSASDTRLLSDAQLRQYSGGQIVTPYKCKEYDGNLNTCSCVLATDQICSPFFLYYSIDWGCDDDLIKKCYLKSNGVSCSYVWSCTTSPCQNCKRGPVGGCAGFGHDCQTL